MSFFCDEAAAKAFPLKLQHWNANFFILHSLFLCLYSRHSGIRLRTVMKKKFHNKTNKKFSPFLGRKKNVLMYILNVSMVQWFQCLCSTDIINQRSWYLIFHSGGRGDFLKLSFQLFCRWRRMRAKKKNGEHNDIWICNFFISCNRIERHVFMV